MKVSRKRNDEKPDIERLEDYDEVWALCARILPPGWRLLGRFFERNVFIALHAWDKRVLVHNYDVAAKEVIDDWNGMLNSQPPVRSANLGDYLGLGEDLSEGYVDVDQTI